MPVTVADAGVSHDVEGRDVRTRTIVAGTIGLAAAAAAVARGLLRRFAIREASMTPTLLDGDWVVAKRRTGVLERGDIVVLDDPGGSGLQLTKRVIGLPGERIGIEGGRVTVNGALLADRWASGATRPDGEWTVGEDEVWLLGDNRAHSISDGRVLGPVPVRDIHWTIVARYWPRDRAGRVG